jgi:hypothetical protein
MEVFLKEGEVRELPAFWVFLNETIFDFAHYSILQLYFINISELTSRKLIKCNPKID